MGETHKLLVDEVRYRFSYRMWASITTTEERLFYHILYSAHRPYKTAKRPEQEARNKLFNYLNVQILALNEKLRDTGVVCKI